MCSIAFLYTATARSNSLSPVCSPSDVACISHAARLAPNGLRGNCVALGKAGDGSVGECATLWYEGGGIGIGGVVACVTLGKDGDETGMPAGEAEEKGEVTCS